MEESKIRNGRNLTNIEYINVYGLFDRYDVNIPFDKIANIYILAKMAWEKLLF